MSTNFSSSKNKWKKDVKQSSQRNYSFKSASADEIKKLNDLLKDRVITQEEFDLQKEKLLNSSTTTSTTDWLTLFLLTFFVGVLGVHRFYVGK